MIEKIVPDIVVYRWKLISVNLQIKVQVSAGTRDICRKSGAIEITHDRVKDARRISRAMQALEVRLVSFYYTDLLI